MKRKLAKYDRIFCNVLAGFIIFIAFKPIAKTDLISIYRLFEIFLIKKNDEENIFYFALSGILAACTVGGGVSAGGGSNGVGLGVGLDLVFASNNEKCGNFNLYLAFELIHR